MKYLPILDIMRKCLNNKTYRLVTKKMCVKNYKYSKKIINIKKYKLYRIDILHNHMDVYVCV